MAQVKFGGKQLKNPTPSRLGNAVKVFTVVGSIILAWIGTANFIPANTSTILQSVLGLLIGIANAVMPFFGVQTEQTDVPIDDVSSTDEKTT